MALADLWVAHKSAVEAYVRARCAPDLVDDVVSQAFTVAWRRLDDVPPDARAWLCGVARNLMLHEFRSDRRQAGLVVRAAPLVQADPGAEEPALTRLALIRAWSGLTDEQRDTLAMIAWDGLSAAEAARIAGISRVAFSVRALRARRRLEALVHEQDAIGLHDASVDPPDHVSPRRHLERSRS